jgi:hypothetical protein
MHRKNWYGCGEAETRTMAQRKNRIFVSSKNRFSVV